MNSEDIKKTAKFIEALYDMDSIPNSSKEEIVRKVLETSNEEKEEQEEEVLLEDK